MSPRDVPALVASVIDVGSNSVLLLAVEGVDADLRALWD
jgi:hypothetical protein